MLLLVLIALIVLTFTLLLHFTHHFKIKYETCNQTTRHSISSDVSNKKICCYRMIAVDDQKFDFFPIAFVLYIIFMLFVCTLIILSEILICINKNKTIYNLLFGYTLLQSYPIHKYQFLSMHTINIYNKSITIITLNLFIVCSVLILAIWESLFSWYRYYTTMKLTLTFRKISNKIVMKQFLYYAIPFSITFIANITLSFYIFICTISLHCSFNIYCSWKFASFLIERVQFLMTMDHDQKDILQSVYCMKRISIICSILHSLNLSLFLIAYNSMVIHYLPILWSIATLLFSLNFIRNRNAIIKRLHSCKPSVFKTNTTAPSDISKNSLSPLPPPPHNTPQVSSHVIPNIKAIKNTNKNILSQLAQHILPSISNHTKPFQRARSQSAEHLPKPKLLTAPPVFDKPKSDPIEIRNRSPINVPVCKDSPLNTAVNISNDTFIDTFMGEEIVPHLNLNLHGTSSSRSELAAIELPPIIQPQPATVAIGTRKVTFSNELKQEKEMECEVDGGVFIDMDVIDENKQCDDLKKQRSKSVGFHHDQNINNAIESFNMLEKYGFVSSKKIKLTSISAQVFDQLSPVQIKNVGKLDYFEKVNSTSAMEKDNIDV